MGEGLKLYKVVTTVYLVHSYIHIRIWYCKRKIHSLLIKSKVKFKIVYNI